MRLNYKRTFFVGLAFLSICAFWQMYDNMVPLMLKNTFHMKETLTGVILALDNVLALFLLPLIGTLSDKVRTPLGKRTPFIVVGTVIAVISMTFLPVANKNVNLTMFMIFLGIVLIAMGCYRSPAVALMPDLTPKPMRSMANAVINLMGAVGGVYSLVIVKIFSKDDNYNFSMIFLAVSAIMILAVVVLLATIRENRLAKQIETEEPEEKKEEIEPAVSADKPTGMPKEVKRSFAFILASIFLWFTAYNAVTSAYSRYAEQVWNLKAGGFTDSLMIATIAAIISYIPIGIIASKIGRKKTIITGILLMTASYLCGALIFHYSAVVNIIFAFTGIGWAAINVNSYPMVVEMCKGSDIGKYTGVYYTFSMSAQIMTPILSGALLEHVSYRTLFPYAVFFSVASLCTMLFVKHGDSKPLRKAKALENFDTPD